MIKKHLILFCLVGILSGCATYAAGPLFNQAPLSPDNKGTLYVFRTKSGGPTPIVKINGKPFVALSVLGYSYAYLSPGIYRLTFEYGAFGDNFISEIEIKEGQEVFEEYSPNGFGQNLREIPKTQALDEMKPYRYINPLNTDFSQ